MEDPGRIRDELMRAVDLLVESSLLTAKGGEGAHDASLELMDHDDVLALDNLMEQCFRDIGSQAARAGPMLSPPPESPLNALLQQR